MKIWFENVDVEMYKMRQGTVVEYENDFWHIQHFYKTTDGRFMLTIAGAFETLDVAPQFVTWLEPN
jgi:hypothetical protein